jgi:hypothetical protein
LGFSPWVLPSHINHQIPSTKYQPSKQTAWYINLLWRAKGNTAFSTNHLAQTGKYRYCFQSARRFTGVFRKRKRRLHPFQGGMSDENKRETRHE